MGVKENLLGKVYGRLTVISPSDSINNRTYWKCRCVCNKVCNVRADQLKDGTTSSCGCLRIERLREKICTHGATGTPTYDIWEAMGQRCNNQNSAGYAEYGGRGIKICDRWLGAEGFSNFLKDMGERPHKLSLDRVDVNGDYSPENCRWADNSLQGFNTRKSKNNTSGRSGVSWDRGRNKWSASIMKNRKTIHLGRFSSFEDAVKAREQAELKYFGFIKE